MAMLERGRRTTCGTRMTDLIGEAAEMDKAFWDSAVWAEGDDDSENDSFDEKEEEVKPDMFDSDFNDTETDESDEDEEGQLKAQGRRERSSAAKSGSYKEPVKPSRPTEQVSAPISTAPKEKRPKPAKGAADPLDPLSVTLRQSTQSRSTARTQELLSAKAQARPRVVRPPIPKKEYSQRDLLLEALQTETVNFKWLKSQQMAEDERNRLESKAVKPTKKIARTLLSSRKSNTITFVDDSAWPALFRGAPPPWQQDGHRAWGDGDSDSDCEEYGGHGERQQPASSLVCAVTGQPARYRDPLTRLPYFDAAAFRHLREAHRLAHQHQQVKLTAGSNGRRGGGGTSSAPRRLLEGSEISPRIAAVTATAAPAGPSKDKDTVPKKRGRKSKAQLQATPPPLLTEDGAELGGQ